MIDDYVDDISKFNLLMIKSSDYSHIVGDDSDEATSFLPPLKNVNKGDPNALDLRTRKNVKKIASASSMSSNIRYCILLYRLFK